METMTISINQKKATIDELSKDLVQANQMLVNFNNHYDNKAKQVRKNYFLRLSTIICNMHIKQIIKF